MKPEKKSACEFCKRDVELTFHHLIPKKMHQKGWVIKKYADVDLIHHGIWLCADCHKQVHKLLDHKQLAEFYFDKERLLSNAQLRKFVGWVSRQKKKVKR
jgi:ribosomal protein L37AE/L43A